MPAGSSVAGPYAEETVVASAARTATGNSGELAGDFGPASTLRVQLNVTAASGVAPTLDVVLEDTLDGTNFNTIATFTQKTAASREVVNVTLPFAKRLRVRWTIGGTTPSFTFSVIAVSQVPST